MISDGDSNAFEAVKHTYIKLLIKNLTHSDSFDEHSSVDFIDKNIDDNSLSLLSTEQYNSNIVTKEDCINHVKKRVSNHLKTLKSKYSGFENVRETSVSSATEKKNNNKVQKYIQSHSSTYSSSDENASHKSPQPVSRSRTRRRLSDGKPYGGGAGRMTKAMEHKLADFYGLAIRQSSESAKGTLIIILIHKIRISCRS